MDEIVKENASCDQMSVVELGSNLARVRARGKFRDQDALDFIPTPESALIYIDTPNYDGPLDLLLHLIKKHSMNIFDIPIVMITKKYLAALDEMRSLNLDIAGEFLLMAATLAEIKSRMLLPKEEQKNDSEEEEEADPRIELMKRLLTYKSFKDASFKLLDRPKLGHEFLLRQATDEEQADNEQEHQDLSLKDLAAIEIFELINRLSEALKKSQKVSVHTITRDRISVSARLHELLDFCKLHQRFTFYQAAQFFPVEEKTDVIVTFLALLEMSRLKLLKLQNCPKESLLISIVKENFYQNKKDIFNNIDVSSREVDYD